MSEVNNDTDENGKINRQHELMVTAIALVAYHPRAAADWYASLRPDELELVAEGFNAMIRSINTAVTVLREYLVNAPPELVEAMQVLEPLLKVKK